MHCNTILCMPNILADQIKSLDWRARNVIHEGAVSAHVLADVRAKIKALLDL